MSSPIQKPLSEVEVDRDQLYREESFTDLKVATIRRLVPIRPDGSEDDTREAIFTGQAQIMSQMGPLPIQCQIEARTLEEATRKFPEAIGRAVEKMVEEAKEMQRQEASRIVVPGAQSGVGLHPPGGAAPLGGKIPLR